MFVFGIFFKTKFGGCEGCIHVMNDKHNDEFLRHLLGSSERNLKENEALAFINGEIIDGIAIFVP